MVNGQQGGHAATLLKNGKVLISGGVLYPSGTGPTAPSLYDSETGAFTPAGPVNGTRMASTATLLHDGTVLIAGGWRNGDASVYDSTSGNLTFLGDLPIWSHTATLLTDGTALVIGGVFFSGSDTYNAYGVESLGTSQIYDPLHASFQPAGSLLQARDGHSATLLTSGLVLVAGGDWNYSRTLSSAELYDPVSRTFTYAGSMIVSRVGHTATLLQDGTILLAGGDALGTAELYVPPPDPWQQAFTVMKTAAGTDSYNFWQWDWLWQRTPSFPGAPPSFGVLGSIDNTPGLIEEIITAGGGNGIQNISAEQWVAYYRQVIVTDPWQQAITRMQASAGTDSYNLWQWAWFWQRSPTFAGAPSGFGVPGSIDNNPRLMGAILAAGGGNGFAVISAEQWMLYYRQAASQELQSH
jgi:hypothetical protein